MQPHADHAHATAVAPSLEGRIPVPGGRLAYWERGDGPAIVCLHGFTLDRRSWLPNLAALSARHRVVLPDLRGHGASSRPEPGELVDHCADLLALFDHLGIERATLVGCSMGGTVALEMALRHPERVERLVLVAPMLRGWNHSAELRDAIEAPARALVDGGLERARERWRGGPIMTLGGGARGVLDRMLEDYDGWHWQHDTRAPQLEPTMAEQLTRIAVPSLVLVGEHDLPDFGEIAELLGRTLPDTRVQTMAGVGHLANLEAPRRFERLVLPFVVDALRPTTGSARAAELYRLALDRILGARAGAEELLDEAIACDPGFSLAHAARWLLASGGDDGELARRSCAAALAGRAALRPWERSHVEALAALIQREPDAPARAAAHLRSHPTDLLIASQWAGETFFHGGPGKRAATLELLRELAPYQDDHAWAFTARLAFHMAEAGEAEAALPLLERALAQSGQAPYVAHAMAHALLESGRRRESAQFVADWLERHDPAGPLDGHIHWHLALGELEAGRADAALARYRRAIAPGVSGCAPGLVLADVGGLFLRLRLQGVAAAGLPREGLSELVEGQRGSLGAPFVAVHAAALHAALDDDGGIERCVDAASALPDGAKREVALGVLTALAAFTRGDLPAVSAALEPGRSHDWEALGGSNEERALFAALTPTV